MEMDCDMVLLGGDLFHDNKPSRHTVIRAIAALKQHCLATDRRVRIQILSDRSKAFVGGYVLAGVYLICKAQAPARIDHRVPCVAQCRSVNYEDGRLHVGLPVFTIHGNHDDPTGADNLSAVDILASCGLVNYFGKVVRVRRVMPGPAWLRRRLAVVLCTVDCACTCICRASMPTSGAVLLLAVPKAGAMRSNPRSTLRPSSFKRCNYWVHTAVCNA